MADIKHSLQNGDCLCAGRYEFETIEMLVKAFEYSRQAYDVDKVVEKLETDSYAIMLDGALVASKEVVIDAKRATEIVKQGGVSNTSGEREIARLCDYAIAENMILTGKP